MPLHCPCNLETARLCSRGAKAFNFASRRLRSPSSDRRQRNSSPTLQERTSTAMHALEHGMEPPGASDKWRVAQLFCEVVPRSVAKIQRIERVINPDTFGKFLQTTGEDTSTGALNECGVVFFSPQDVNQLNQICSHGLQSLSSSCVVSDCGVAVQRQLELRDQSNDQPEARSMCVLFCGPEVALRRLGGATDRPKDDVEFGVEDPQQFLVAYTIHYQLLACDASAHCSEFRVASPSPERARSASRSRRVTTRNPLIQKMLQRLPELGDDVAGASLAEALQADAGVSGIACRFELSTGVACCGRQPFQHSDQSSWLPRRPYESR